MLKVQMTYKNIQRMRHIVAVLIKHGFYSVVERMNLHRILPLSKRLRKRAVEEAELSLPERIRLVFEELGPTFIKLGQLLSTRPDIFSEEYLEEFRKFQDKVPPFPFDKAIQQIESEFKRRLTSSSSRLRRSLLQLLPSPRCTEQSFLTAARWWSRFRDPG